VFNLNEVGSLKWENRKVKRVLVPASLSPDDIFHPISRRYSHITILACVSVAGDALNPMIIMGVSIRDSLWEQGLRQDEDEDAIIRSRIPTYIDTDLFNKYISTVLVSYVTNVRNNLALANEPVILLMDSTCPQVFKSILRRFGKIQIIALVFLAHTKNLFQTLDLVFFGILKKLKQTISDD
jgi:hypothetical protein